PKSNSLIEGTQDLPGLVRGDIFTVVAPGPDLLAQNLLGSKLIPNDDCAAKDYRIFRVTLCIDGYGDVNGDGYIDALDVARANDLIGESLSSASTQQKIADGYISTLEMLRADVDGDGYITSVDVALIGQFIRREIAGFPVGVSFNHLELQVQQAIGRYDGYFDCDGYVRLDGYLGLNIVSPDDLDPFELIYDGYLKVPDMNGSDPVFDSVPFIPVPYAIIPQAFWQDYLLAFSSESRLVPAIFTFGERTFAPNCQTGLDFTCTDRSFIEPSCDPGRNDFYLPDNLIMRRGQILNPDGSQYAVDLEVVPIVIELPAIPLSESSLNVFEKLIADFSDGKTAAGFPAMRFSDCTTVKPDALFKNQVRFGVSIQSFYPNLDGYTELDGYGVIVDDIIGVFMDSTNGILTLSIKDLAEDPVFLTLVTKIQVMVYLKKAGWKNMPRVVQSTELQGLLS
ncbi:MAG: hypothetical protein HC877_24330, partial [Thioploca sp.]|nr:hypothetical protein [Thioploca sp.]